MDEPDEVINILPRPGSKIHQIMFFDPVDTIILCCRAQAYPRQLFEFLHTALQIETIIGCQDNIGLTLCNDLRTEIFPLLRGIRSIDRPRPFQHLLLGTPMV